MNLPDNDFSRFHDAELIGLSIARSAKQLRLDFLTGGGEKVSLSVTGVRMFRAVDIGTQNVVSRIVCVGHGSGMQVDTLSTLKWAAELVDAPSHLSDEVAQRYFEKISGGSLCMVRIEPSVGGDIVVLGEGVAVE